MSRLIVKGLPKHYADADLHKLITKIRPPTDARVMHTKDGKSRQFGFVGLATKADASAVRTALNSTYVGVARISVELARKIGDDAIPRPWSRHSKGSSKFDKMEGERGRSDRKQFLEKEKKRLGEFRDRRLEKERKEKAESTGLLPQFLEVAGKRRENPVWADGKIQLDMVPSRKTGGEGKLLQRMHVTFDESDKEDDDALYEELPSKEEQQDEEEKGGDVALNQQVSDMDYFKSKVVDKAARGDYLEKKEGDTDENDTGEHVSTASPDVSEPESKEEPSAENLSNGDREEDAKGPSNGSEESKEQADQNPRKSTEPLQREKKRYISDGVDAAETGRLMVRNLAFSTKEEDLETLFETFGTLADVHIVKDSATNRSRGLGFVQYMIHENAAKALLALDRSFHGGRILHILPAKPRPPANGGVALRASTKPGSSSFKNEREVAQKEAARTGADGTSQHAMHMSTDAVAAVAAQRHGVSKADLLGIANGDSGIAAVRLAMAEAGLQAETRSYLLSHGVDLAKVAQLSQEIEAKTAAAKRKRRSRVAFLAKNLPAQTKRAAVEKLFRRFGTITRLVLVPSGLLAVVQYSTSTEAKKAYNSLAYTKFGDTPLYLEWLPNEVLSESEASTAVDVEPLNDENAALDTTADETANIEEENGCSVYVKNLNFDTRDDALKTHFRKVLKKRSKLADSLRSAKVALKRGVEGKESEKLSMGFGFLEFDTPEDAVEAVKIAQNTMLDGHVLQLRLSNNGKGKGSDKSAKRKRSTKTFKPCAKLIIRNVSFEATRKDIRRLFGAFGELKTVRIPKKMDGSHRGFAFVEFVSKGEATAAYEALTSAHLYGRHLVIEYADERNYNQASIAELQSKTAEYISKKSIRRNDGTRQDLLDGEQANEEDVDEQAEMQDALYA